MVLLCHENGIYGQASLYDYTHNIIYKISNKTKPLTYHYPIEINLEEDDVSIGAGRAQQLYFDGCLSDGLSGQTHGSTQHEYTSPMMTGGTQSQHSMNVPHQ